MERRLISVSERTTRNSIVEHFGLKLEERQFNVI